MSPICRIRLERERDYVESHDLSPWLDRKIDLLYELPEEPESYAAVYFLFNGPEAIYVGGTHNAWNRVRDHIRNRRYARVRFTKIGVMAVPDEAVFTIERHYIDALRPRLND